MAATGECIVCGSETSHRSERGSWRCDLAEFDACADRRDTRRRRPKHRSKTLDHAIAVIAVTPAEAVHV